jgi:hypothetical protein
VEFDSTYTAYIIFGNNRAGLLPSQGSQISVTYRTGGGSIGNIVAGSVSTQTIINPPNYEISVPVTFNNYTKGQYGYNGDTIDDIRKKLPQYLRTQNRAVTGLDYKTLSEQFVSPYQGQIGKSVASLRNYGCSANIVDLYILAKQDEQTLEKASDQLKDELKTYIEANKMITDFVCMRDGLIISVDVSVDIFIDRLYRKFEDEIREKITRRLSDLFLLGNWDYGKAIRDSDVIKKLSDIKEPDHYEVSFTNDVEAAVSIIIPKFNEIIRPGTITLNFQYEQIQQ